MIGSQVSEELLKEGEDQIMRAHRRMERESIERGELPLEDLKPEDSSQTPNEGEPLEVKDREGRPGGIDPPGTRESMHTSMMSTPALPPPHSSHPFRRKERPRDREEKTLEAEDKSPMEGRLKTRTGLRSGPFRIDPSRRVSPQ